MTRRLPLLFLLLVLAGGAAPVSPQVRIESDHASHRGPVAAWYLEADGWLYVALATAPAGEPRWFVTPPDQVSNADFQDLVLNAMLTARGAAAPLTFYVDDDVEEDGRSRESAHTVKAVGQG